MKANFGPMEKVIRRPFFSFKNKRKSEALLRKIDRISAQGFLKLQEQTRRLYADLPEPDISEIHGGMTISEVVEKYGKSALQQFLDDTYLDD